jgi:fumarate hydratase subunit alpha
MIIGCKCSFGNMADGYKSVKGEFPMIDEILLQKEVRELVFRSATNISADVKGLLEKALEKESNDTAKSMLSAMLENVELANEKNMPVCQSPGFPTIYISFGNHSLPGNIKDMFKEAIVQCTKEGLLRPSMVHTLTRKNSGDNSGDGVPNFEFDYNPDQDYLEMIISFKGCGAELANELRIFTTPMLGKDLSGLKRFILETVIKAGGKPCPPYGIGIGLGGQMDVAAKLSRKAISIRKWDDENKDELYANLEKELLQDINALGIGAAGTGGDTVALAVKIEGAYTHTAIAPVAINFHCWVARRAGLRIYTDGRKEIIF